MQMPRVLFVLKRRADYGVDPHAYSQQGMSTGLLNSATFMKDMLIANGFGAKIAVVVDNNCIDREVTEYKPTHVIIEALWVVPSKFDVLTKLHPTVQWIVRYHSDAPFLAGEGVAMEWTVEYLKRANVTLGINAPRLLNELREVADAMGMCNVHQRIVYLPNFYPHRPITVGKCTNPDTIKIGCFGAVRPLKNQFLQAIAAIKFAKDRNVGLEFHINGNRTEGKGENALKNMRSLFAGLGERYKLVEHDWMPHTELLKLMATMDIGMQVSFSETFNIVAADMITAGVPVVGSAEIPWLKHGVADPTSSDEIAHKLHMAHTFKCFNIVRNTLALRAYTQSSERSWITYLMHRAA